MYQLITLGFLEGPGCGSVVERLPSLYEGLGWIPGTRKKKFFSKVATGSKIILLKNTIKQWKYDLDNLENKHDNL